ncbi:S-layer homology domain-containing protein [Phascolarctobacterium succinatutens]|uniref:S-layer homology domain-containing protein n=1 Tax=Phascolarctobacterium succinatutens TaxID=626940 RepID=UPI0026F1AF0D|nr:S-layer homology domain-containing protein [Phascolarctobacterium succinatutens]
MKKSLVLAMAMALGVTASAYAANPFSDVPAGHWAYDSINKLAAAGVIEGYGDTTFGGDKLMTRYEMAQIVAKAMAKGANVDKLAAEFADELDNLGVRVAALEKKADNVKITGTIKASYSSYDGDKLNVDGKKAPTNHQGRLRSDLWVKGDINDDWTYSAMFRNQQFFTNDKGNSGEEDVAFQRAYVNGKLGGLAVQAGRYNKTDITGGNIHDNRVDGVQVSYGKDVKLTAGYGKATGVDVIAGENKDVAYAELGAKLGAVDAFAGYYKFDNLLKANDDDAIWTVGLGFDLAKDLKLTGTYLRSDVDTVTVDSVKYNDVDKDGYVVGLAYKGAKAAKAGSWGLNASYYDQGAGTVVAHTMDGIYFDEGFKGYSVGANYALAKNIVAGVTYYDLESKEAKGTPDAQTLWSQVVFSF